MTTQSALVVTEPSLRLFTSYMKRSFTKDELVDLAYQFRAKTLQEINTFYACVSEGLFLFPRIIEFNNSSYYNQVLQYLLRDQK